MEDFIKTLYISEEFEAEFLFRFLHLASGVRRYHVSVESRDNQTIFFEIEEKSSTLWKIIDAPKVPDWILKAEHELSNSVIEISKT